MNAIDLYQKSLKAAREMDYLNYEPMNARTVNLLGRKGFLLEDNSGLDNEKLRDAVLDGSIWTVYMLGEVGIKQICEYLARIESKIDR